MKLTYSPRTPERLRTPRHSDQLIYGGILISSLISLFASFVLSVDAITLAKDSKAALSCNINQVISCGTVGQSWQAHAFGFPNAFVGLMFEPIICTIAVLGLCRVSMPRVFLALTNAVYGLALIFALWLFYESITEIHALCPYCLLVTLGTGLVFFNFLHLNLRDGNFSRRGREERSGNAFLFYYGDVFTVALYLTGILMAVILAYGTALFA